MGRWIRGQSEADGDGKSDEKSLSRGSKVGVNYSPEELSLGTPLEQLERTGVVIGSYASREYYPGEIITYSKSTCRCAELR